MMLADQLAYLPEDILTKTDRASMAASLELRVPLLDPRVVEFAWRLPAAHRWDGRRGKRLLRQLLYRLVPPRDRQPPQAGLRDSRSRLAARPAARAGCRTCSILLRCAGLACSMPARFPAWSASIFRDAATTATRCGRCSSSKRGDGSTHDALAHPGRRQPATLGPRWRREPGRPPGRSLGRTRATTSKWPATVFRTERPGSAMPKSAPTASP